MQTATVVITRPVSTQIGEQRVTRSVIAVYVDGKKIGDKQVKVAWRERKEGGYTDIQFKSKSIPFLNTTLPHWKKKNVRGKSAAVWIAYVAE